MRKFLLVAALAAAASALTAENLFAEQRNKPTTKAQSSVKSTSPAPIKVSKPAPSIKPLSPGPYQKPVSPGPYQSGTPPTYVPKTNLTTLKGQSPSVLNPSLKQPLKVDKAPVISPPRDIQPKIATPQIRPVDPGPYQSSTSPKFTQGTNPAVNTRYQGPEVPLYDESRKKSLGTNTGERRDFVDLGGVQKANVPAQEPKYQIPRTQFVDPGPYLTGARQPGSDATKQNALPMDALPYIPNLWPNYGPGTYRTGPEGQRGYWFRDWPPPANAYNPRIISPRQESNPMGYPNYRPR